ncbi:hypothetical protein DL93DRAFT_2166504 [Clavulina sp. PMI_390]|nr:hypothetical protein DL93DRAFT_2166504 [Clavulina sp. PMI_390]
MLLDDGSQPLEFNGLAGRRLSLAYTPAGEPSLDAYDQEIGYEASDPNSDLDGGRQRRMSMAEHLDERSQMDLTTPDSIAAQADRLSMDMDHGFPTDDIDASRANLSMTKVTMDLQGHKSPLSQDFHAAAQRKPVASPLGPSTAPATRRKSMSEYLSEAAMADTTDPTKNPGQRRPSRAQDAPTSRPTMSSVLDQVSSSDMTLHKNIASPPKSRQSSFAAGSASTRTTRKSFTALNDVPTMAEIGMDARISRDDTNTASSPGAKVSRRKSQAAADQYAGIDPAELKKRRMSSFMTDATNVDATLLHNIQNPPSVDQENHPAASTPHSLSSRRQSVATTA